MKPALAIAHIVSNGLKYALLGMVVFSILLHYVGLPKITSHTIQRLPSENQYPVLLPHIMPDFWNPWHVPDNMPAIYQYNITLSYHGFQQPVFHVAAIGCVDHLNVNGTEYPLDTNRRCNRDIGFFVNLASYLHSGDNQIKITVNNIRIFAGSRPYDTATYGLEFAPLLTGPGSFATNLLSWLVIASFCTSIVLGLQRATGERYSGLIVCGGLMMFLRQLKYTTYMQYVIDMPSHFEYICYIANHGFPPQPREGWEYYHPPLYYRLEAKLMHFSNWLGSFDAMTIMRLFSLMGFMTFLLLSTLMLNRIVRNRVAFYASLAFLVFYPGGILFATRLDSHLLLYAFYSGCIYCLFRWLEEDRMAYLWLAVGMFGLALATRSNALALLPLIGCTFLYQLYKRKFRLIEIFTPAMLAAMAIVAFGVSVNFGRALQANTPSLIVGNINNVQRTQLIANTFEHVLMLDTQTLFNMPFIDWWHDNTGRQYFWNTALKTSLFEHFTMHAYQESKRLVLLVLGIMLYVIASAIMKHPANPRQWSICAGVFMLSLMALMGNRILHPFAPSQDYRYIYPSLVGLSGLLGLTIEQYLSTNQRLRAYIGIGMAVVFVWTSIVMIREG